MGKRILFIAALLILILGVVVYVNYDVADPDGNGYLSTEIPKADASLEIPLEQYKKPSEEQLKSILTELQYEVTQKDKTEPPYENEYWDNYDRGIYVDIVTGEPLFFSTDKYKSGTGWPSFTKPITPEVITLHKDNKLIVQRTEVRSRIGDSHLGHVFEDGPKEEGGLRYCMNSAALNFIPYDEMEVKGYGYLMEYLK